MDEDLELFGKISSRPRWAGLYELIALVLLALLIRRHLPR